jgi:RimJ/RimL family protein N-acetyltransferase
LSVHLEGRIQRYIESKAGLPLRAFPQEGVCIRESPARRDEPANRLLIQRVTGREGVLVTAIPRVISWVTPALRSMTPPELFSPLGRAEIGRALGKDDAESLAPAFVFDYALTKVSDFRPARTPHLAKALTKKDIPPEQFDLRMSERREPLAADFIWAFACYHSDPDMPAQHLAAFGPRCASIAIVIWKPGPVATFGVGTEVACRGRGYGLAAVSAATRWILDQGAVALYGAYADNIPSLRIARRLGFSLVHQEMGA